MLGSYEVVLYVIFILFAHNLICIFFLMNITLLFIFLFLVHPKGAQVILLALLSGIIPGLLGETIWRG